jgi:SAM-dependent methyltransferase
MGAATRSAAKTAIGELVTRISALDGYRIWAPQYDEQPNPILRLEARVLRSRVEIKGRRVLDVATGTGRWMEYTQGTAHTVVGIDLCPDMLHRAAQKPGLRGRLACADLRALPFAELSVDLALCSFAFGYLPSIHAAMYELGRVARSVIVSDLHPAAITAGWTRSFRAGREVFEIDQHNHPVSELQDAATAAGLFPEWRIEAHFEESERELFRRAGKQDQFIEAARIPAVLITAWSKP